MALKRAARDVDGTLWMDKKREKKKANSVARKAPYPQRHDNGCYHTSMRLVF
jgi:hypothetical protein